MRLRKRAAVAIVRQPLARAALTARFVVSAAIADLPRELAGFPHRTAILLLDPLAGNGEEVTLMTAAALGDQPMAGGAAGDDLQMKTTLVSCGERAASDALVVVQLLSKEPLGLGVRHGHRPLSKPLRVSRARGATVEEIEGRPAWDVWLEQTKEQAAPRARRRQARAGRRGCVPLAIRSGPRRGRRPSQVSSALEAARQAKERLGGREAAGALVFDCICRNLILGDEFASAVSGIAQELGGVPIAGFETYGEVAMDAGDMSGFHNTTSVVLAFPK